MRIAASAVLSTLLVTAAQAQDLPALFAVTDVATDDVLNVRDAPGVAGTIIGTLAPDARAVEVIDRDPTGRWGQVNIGEGAGWASLRFLSALPNQSFPPIAYQCFGTEPFWDLTVAGTQVTWTALGQDTVPLTKDFVAQPMRPDRFAMRALGDLSSATAVIRKATCSDGMSDRAYGLEIDLILDGGDHMGTQVYSGCCSLGN